MVSNGLQRYENLVGVLTKCFKRLEAEPESISTCRSLETLIQNKDLLVNEGSCPFDNEIEEWVGHPFWLYPRSDFLTDSEEEKIDRELVYQLKQDILQSLLTLYTKNWLNWFLERLEHFSADAQIGQFYLALDRLYAFHALSHLESRLILPPPISDGPLDVLAVHLPSLTIQNSYSLKSLPGCSGGLSDIIEMVYPFYERYHFDDRDKFVTLFKQLDIKGVGADLDALESTIGEFCRSLCDFQRQFVGMTNGALGQIEIIDSGKAPIKFDFYKCLVDQRPSPFFDHNELCTRVRLGEEVFYLNGERAKVIKALIKNYRDNENHPLSSQDLDWIVNRNEDGTNFIGLESKFKGDGGSQSEAVQVFRCLIERV